MSFPLDEITKLLAGLATGSPVIKTLELLKTVLVSTNPGELKEYVPKIDMDRLFTCLSTNDK